MNPDWGSLWALHHLHIKTKNRFIGHMGGCEPAANPKVSAISNRLMPFNTILCRKGSHEPTPPLLQVPVYQLLLESDCGSQMCCLNCSCTGCALHWRNRTCARCFSKPALERWTAAAISVGIGNQFKGFPEIWCVWNIVLCWYRLLRSGNTIVLFQKLS